MRCKIGDLCIVVKGYSSNLGKPCIVVSQSPYPEYGFHWLIEPSTMFIARNILPPNNIALYPVFPRDKILINYTDDALLPITPPPDMKKEEIPVSTKNILKIIREILHV